MDMITSTANLLIKQTRALRQRKARAETETFLVEGIHHVGAAVEAGWQVETILHAPDLLTSDFARDLLARADRLRLNVQPVSPQVMELLADKDNPQGILAVVRQRALTFDEVGEARRVVALVAPQDPGNVGTILRSMDATGADLLLLLDGGVELYHPTVVRASMGTLFWKPVVESTFEQFVDWGRSRGLQLIGTSARGSVDYQSFRAREPWALVLGNEQKGLSPAQIAACEATLSLPMRGRVSSLNLAVAAGVLLYRFCAE